MRFPLGLYDISLWSAVTIIILLVSSELLSPQNFQGGLIIERKHLRKAVIILGVLFLSTAAIRIYQIISAL